MRNPDSGPTGPPRSAPWPIKIQSRDWSEALAEQGRLKRLAAASAAWRGRRPAAAPKAGRRLLPLVIGVTGHRDVRPEDVPALKEALGRVLGDLRARCPHTPLMLLSALAEGADRLAAEVFLATGSGRLAVPLPLEPAAYRATFGRETPEFDTLLARAESVFLIPTPPPAEEGPEPDYRQEPHCYAALGSFLVEHSHILLALWDGSPGEKTGGTAQVVRRQLTGQPEPRPGLKAELLSSIGHPVIHIHTPRLTEAEAPAGRATPPGTVAALTPAEPGDALELFKMTMKRLEEFNRGLGGLDDRELNEDLWPKEQAADLTEAERLIQALQDQTGALANRWAARLRGRLKFLFLGGWLALLSFQGYRLVNFFVPEGVLWPFILVSSLMTVLVLLGYAQAHLGGWQNKHLSYRGLAEAWRVRFYWRIFGVDQSVARESFSGERVEDFGETRWLRLALAYTEFEPPPEEAPEAAFPRRRLARELWLGRQRDFFRKKSAASLKNKNRCLWPAIITLSLGSVWVLFGKFLQVSADVHHLEGQFLLILFLSLIIFVAAWETYHRLSSQVGDDQKWLTLVLAGSGLASAALILPQTPLSPALTFLLSVGGVVSLGTGGFLVGYLKLSAHAENAKRYRDSERLFARAQALLEEGRWPERAVVTFLGRKALAENSAWLRQHLERPINLPLS